MNYDWLEAPADPTAEATVSPSRAPAITYDVLPADDEVSNSALEDALLSVIGEYTPIARTNEVILSDGTVSTQTVYCVDVPWIASFGVLITLIFCFCRALGGLLKGD